MWTWVWKRECHARSWQAWVKARHESYSFIQSLGLHAFTLAVLRVSSVSFVPFGCFLPKYDVSLCKLAKHRSLFFLPWSSQHAKVQSPVRPPSCPSIPPRVHRGVSPACPHIRTLIANRRPTFRGDRALTNNVRTPVAFMQHRRDSAISGKRLFAEAAMLPGLTSDLWIYLYWFEVKIYLNVPLFLFHYQTLKRALALDNSRPAPIKVNIRLLTRTHLAWHARNVSENIKYSIMKLKITYIKSVWIVCKPYRLFTR